MGDGSAPRHEERAVLTRRRRHPMEQTVPLENLGADAKTLRLQIDWRGEILPKLASNHFNVGRKPDA
ncbi:MAG: hypothetical protein NVSMB1_07260 [Polyangiales bacterium]